MNKRTKALFMARAAARRSLAQITPTARSARLGVIFLMMVLTASTAWATTSTLTVYDAVGDDVSTNNNVPVSKSEFGWNHKFQSEFLIPSSVLTAMSGTDIKEMTFYATATETFTFGSGATYQVYMKEVESVPSSGFSGTSDATVVYEGSLTVTSSTMTITFTTPYAYYGGNLLIGFYSSNTGVYSPNPSNQFYGQSSETKNRYGAPDDVYPSYFFPKTTFTYEAKDVTKDVAAATVNGLQESYWWREGAAIPISYTLTNSEGETIPTTGYTAVIKNSNNQTVESVTAKDNYTLTFTGIDPYYNSKTLRFSVNDYYINLPATGSEQVEIPGYVTTFHIYDDGGASGSYSNNCNGTITLTAPDGKLIGVEGYMQTITSGDFLTIYNGTSADEANSLGSFTEDAHVGPLLSTGRSMTFNFYSDAYSYSDGFDLTARVTDNPTYAINGLGRQTGGSVTASVDGETVTSCHYAARVTLDITPDAGYVLTGVTVNDGTNNLSVTGGTWYDNTATFTMTNKDVTVSATFTEIATAQAAGLCINMSSEYKSSTSVTIPSGVTSFSIYDAAGPNATTEDLYTRLTVTLEDDMAMRVTGSTSFTSGYCNIYGGDTKIFDGVESSDAISCETPGNVLVVNASSDNTDVALNVEVISPYRELTVGETQGADRLNFSFSGDGVINEGGTYKAKAGTTITLTMTRKDDQYYYAYSVDACKQDDESVKYDVNWYGFLCPTATITMPLTAVHFLVKSFSDVPIPVLSPGLMIPRREIAEVNVPSNLAFDYFMVYDFAGEEGDVSGKYGNIYDPDDGTLLLTAPEGKTFQLSNTSYIEAPQQKYLIIYNADNNETLTSLTTSTNEASRVEASETDLCRRIKIQFCSYASSGGEPPYEGVSLRLHIIDIPALTLNDASANDLSDKTNKTFDVTLAGRTLYKDGKWNTLCLPFSVSDFTGTPLADATVMELDATGTYDTDKNTGYDAMSGTLYLYFKNAESIVAGRPYIVKWGSGDNIESPSFTGVTIDATTPVAVTSADGTVTFTGTYSPVALTPGDKSNLFLGETNTLYYPNSANNADDIYYVNAFRAYFHISDASTNVRAFVLGFGEDDRRRLRKA